VSCEYGSERPERVTMFGSEVVAERRLSKSVGKVVVYTPFVTVPAFPPILIVLVLIH
jgi:hypothetical protein